LKTSLKLLCTLIILLLSLPAFVAATNFQVNYQFYIITVSSSYGSPTATNSSVIPGSSYPTSVTSPASGGTTTRYLCTGYQIDGGAIISGSSYTFTNVNANYNIQYNWVTQYQITASHDSNSVISPDTSAWYNSSSSQTFTYSASSGYSITYVLVDGIQVAITGSYTFTNIQAPHTITVITTQTLYTITASTGTGGTIAPIGTINVVQGNNQIFTASPNIGYYTTNFVVDGTVIPATSDTYTFTNVQASHTITANFAVNIYGITASADANSQINPNGLVIVNYANTQTFTYTANSGYQISEVLVDGAAVSLSSTTGTYTFTYVQSNHTIAISSSVSTGPTATPAPTPVPSYNPHGHQLQTLNLYLRSDTYTFNSITAYGLDTDYNNTYVQIPLTTATVNATIIYGFRVYITSSTTQITELTAGTPQAQITLTQNYTGQISSAWTCPHANIILGYQALRANIYASTDGGATWTIQATYISNVLVTDEIMPATWTFTLNVNIAQNTVDTVASFTFGDVNHKSTINGIIMTVPKYTDIQTWQWMKGDLIGLIIGSYLNIIGGSFYVMIFLTIFGSLYFRHKSVGPIILVAIIFGGGSGLSVWILMPAWAAAVFSVIIILAVAALIFKVIR
jgi:hypothetical protein